MAHTLLLCTPETAYVVPASLDEAAQAELEKYYKSVTYIKDLRAVTDPVIKVAVFCGRGSEKHLYPTFASTVGHLGVAVSGQVWLDIMSPDGNKGAGLRQLADCAAEYGVRRAHGARGVARSLTAARVRAGRYTGHHRLTLDQNGVERPPLPDGVHEWP